MNFLDQTQQMQQKTKVVELIDAVCEIFAVLFEEQQQALTANTTINSTRASRLNNTTGVNKTDEEFVKTMEEKELNKKKTMTKKKTKTSTIKPCRTKRRKKMIGLDSGLENHDNMEIESDVRDHLDFATSEA